MKRPIAFTYIGDMYLKGMGVEKNLSIALDYFEKAAYYGDSDAIELFSEVCL